MENEKRQDKEGGSQERKHGELGKKSITSTLY